MPSLFKSIDPFSQTVIQTYVALTPQQIAGKLHVAQQTNAHWRTVPMHVRAELLHTVAAYLRTHQEALAQLITSEMGKILPEARAEVAKSAGNLDYYATHAPELLRDTVVAMGVEKSAVAYEPLGTVFAIMPWNYPVWQVMRYVAPCIMAGNTTVLKHAPNVFGCGAFLERAFLECGAPEGLFQSLVMDVDQVEQVIAHDAVQLVTLTGSERAGAAVASLAGIYVKKSILELGGSDPFIVLSDANIDKAAKVGAYSRTLNAGQACICAKRFLVVESVADAFLDALEGHFAALRQGDPSDEATHLGPLARPDLAENLRRQLTDALQQGARLRYGGTHDGCNFVPTLLENVSPAHAVFHEETFGPLGAVTRVKDEQEAIRLANAHRYGLAASLWTADLEKGYALARQLEVGNVFVNSLVRSDSRLPFGGVKKSGYGRELGELGLKELCNAKTIVVEADTEVN